MMNAPGEVLPYRRLPALLAVLGASAHNDFSEHSSAALFGSAYVIAMKQLPLLA
jgi:hypothetical protein